MLFGRKRYRYLSMVMLYLKLVPWMAVTKVIYSIINAIVPTVSIIVTAMFIDNATAVIINGESMSAVVFPLLGIIAIRIFNYYAGTLIGLISIKAEGKLKVEVSPVVAERSACVKYKYYENQDSVDTISRVMGGFEQNIQGFFDHFFNTFSLISGIVGFIVILGTKLWWASLVFVATAIPAFIISYQFGKKRYDVDKEMTKIDRRAWYISGILTGRNTVEERYMYGYTPEMDREYLKNHKKARIARKKVTKSLWVNTKLAGILVFISGAIVVAILVPQVMPSGGGAALSVGMFISLVNALFGLSQQL